MSRLIFGLEKRPTWVWVRFFAPKVAANFETLSQEMFVLEGNRQTNTKKQSLKLFGIWPRFSQCPVPSFSSPKQPQPGMIGVGSRRPRNRWVMGRRKPSDLDQTQVPVDGWNPASVTRWFIPLFLLFYTSLVFVWDFWTISNSNHMIFLWETWGKNWPTRILKLKLKQLAAQPRSWRHFSVDVRCDHSLEGRIPPRPDGNCSQMRSTLKRAMDF